MQWHRRCLSTEPLFTLLVLDFLFFFFSSRRRHTRRLSDWNSDVCSSDLQMTTASSSNADKPNRWPNWGKARRSEERRVGKERRSRWSPYHSKKKACDR